MSDLNLRDRNKLKPLIAFVVANRNYKNISEFINKALLDLLEFEINFIKNNKSKVLKGIKQKVREIRIIDIVCQVYFYTFF